MENKKNLSLKAASIFAAAVSALAVNNEIASNEVENNLSTPSNNIEYTVSKFKAKPVGVFKLNPLNLDASRFVTAHRSHASHSSHSSHSSHRSRTSFA